MLTRGTQSRTGFLALLCLAVLAWAAIASAQLPMPSSTQFDVTGFLQSATLDGKGTGAHQGGHLVVNGQTIEVPAETIVILPANALTWAELFSQAPAPYTGVATGLAMNDSPAPITTYEVHVVGNRVLGGPGGADIYIAGLIDIAQNGLNSGAGFINFMDYAKGEMRIGGVVGDSTTGTRVQINDPTGRYGRVMTPDARFTVDPDNPTIAAGTGFPMCFPRVDPATGFDALCPQSQRPVAPTGFAASIQMNDPVAAPGAPPDATIQAPFEVGDYVTFAGTLVNDSATPTVAVQGSPTYISAHTITNNVAIYTWPGTNPAYVTIEVGLIGTGGLTVIGAGEAAIRTRFEGMSTDPSRNIHLYGIDLNPLDGSTSDRDWGTIGQDPGPPNGAVKGRWRFRPPCTAAVATDKACTPPAAGVFLPPTREVRAVIEGAWAPPVPPAQSPTFANGLIAGQYHAPIEEYIFPENIPGSPIVENNFNALDFLAKGGYTSSGGTLAGQLNPWPSSNTPTPACSAPVADAGGPYTVAFGGSVTLTGTATGTAPLTYAWSVLSQDGVINPLNTASTTYTATCPGAPGGVCVSGFSHPISLTVTNACGSNTANSSVFINSASAPTVAPIAPVSVFSGAAGSFNVTATDPNVPALTPLTWTVSQTGAPALSNLTITSTGPTSATVSFIAPILPANQTVNSVVNVSVVATNTAAIPSPAGNTTVTIKPIPDAVAITSAQYRTGKQRLDLTATSSADPNATLTLNPYLTEKGATFDPAGIGNVFVSLGPGAGYSITVVGAPPPACNLGGTYATPCAQRPLTAKSSRGGVSPATPLDRIRQ
jgi:hypothetical protein